MAKYTLLAVGGFIILLLGILALLGGIGQYQAKEQFNDKLSDDQNRFEQMNATGGYDVCVYNNDSRALDCPDNPYTGSLPWLIGGFAAIFLGGGTVYYDVEERA